MISIGIVSEYRTLTYGYLQAIEEQDIEEDPPGPFVVFKTEHDQVIVTDRTTAEADRDRIMAVYNITSDRSPDLVKTTGAAESLKLSLSY